MSAFDDLARTIHDSMEGIATQEAARRAKNNQAMRGIIKNNMVKVNGRLYPYRIATDMTVNENMPVYVMIGNGGGEAVIIGGE
jgi:hypothetical protein